MQASDIYEDGKIVSNSAEDIGDQELLANIGYKQEMKRSFGLLSIIGFTFSILSCWSALAGSLGAVMVNGGPAILVYGWIGCCFFSLSVVIVMAELCSAYPVAGGQYSWCLFLAKNTGWGRQLSYFCGWIQLAGILGMVAVSWYQFSLYIIAIAVLENDTFNPQNWKTALVAYGCGVFALAVDTFGKKLLHFIATASLYWSIGGFITCTVVILACTPKFQSPKFVFTQTLHSGWKENMGISAIIGIMQSAFGIATYDSVAHLAEETEEASKQTPRAMVMAVIIGFVTGFGFTIALLFCIQDLDAVVNTKTGLPLIEIFYQATSSKAGSICLICITIVCQIFAAFSLLTEGSRAVYAFARDGAFPFGLNKYLGSITPGLDVPLYGLLVCFIVSAILVAILFGSSTAFFTVLSIASTGLYISYLLPIFVYTIRREHKAPGYYNIGKGVIVLQILALVYLVFCCIFFFFPTEIPTTSSNMNYCIVAVGITVILCVGSWFAGGRHTYCNETDIIEGQLVEEIDANEKRKDLELRPPSIV